MRKILSQTIMMFALCMISNQAYCVNNYITDLNTALKLSKETKQEIIVIFSADWCGYCKTLKKDFVNLPDLDNKIVCMIDVDENKRLTKQFKAKTLPTSVILDATGSEISRLSGYEKKSYEEWLISHR